MLAHPRSLYLTKSPVLFLCRPFWLSPRQALIVPVAPTYYEYAEEVRQAVHNGGFYVDVDVGADTLNKKIRNGQLAQYNFILGVLSLAC